MFVREFIHETVETSVLLCVRMCVVEKKRKKIKSKTKKVPPPGVRARDSVTYNFFVAFFYVFFFYYTFTGDDGMGCVHGVCTRVQRVHVCVCVLMRGSFTSCRECKSCISHSLQ